MIEKAELSLTEPKPITVPAGSAPIGVWVVGDKPVLYYVEPPPGTTKEFKTWTIFFVQDTGYPRVPNTEPLVLKYLGSVPMMGQLVIPGRMGPGGFVCVGMLHFLVHEEDCVGEPLGDSPEDDRVKLALVKDDGEGLQNPDDDGEQGGSPAPPWEGS
jgi:hypothetical protein